MNLHGTLVRKLVLAVVLKLVVLTLLWGVFIKGQKVPVNSEAPAAHLLTPSAVAPKED